MIDAAVERMYSEIDENRFLEVTYANGDKEILYFKDFNSGAMIQNIVDRAKKMAIKDFLTTGPAGIRVEHLLTSCVDEFKENEDLPNTTNPDDWARISGKKGERIVYIRTLITGKERHRAGPLDRQRRQHRPVPLTARATRRSRTTHGPGASPGRRAWGRRPGPSLVARRRPGAGPDAVRRWPATAGEGREGSPAEQEPAEHDRCDHHEGEGRTGAGGHPQQHPGGHRAHPDRYAVAHAQRRPVSPCHGHDPAQRRAREERPRRQQDAQHGAALGVAAPADRREQHHQGGVDRRTPRRPPGVHVRRATRAGGAALHAVVHAAHADLVPR